MFYGYNTQQSIYFRLGADVASDWLSETFQKHARVCCSHDSGKLYVPYGLLITNCPDPRLFNVFQFGDYFVQTSTRVSDCSLSLTLPGGYVNGRNFVMVLLTFSLATAPLKEFETKY